MFRGYDSSEVFCEDTLLRIKHLYGEIVTLQKSVEGIKHQSIPIQKTTRTAKPKPRVGIPPKKHRNDSDPDPE